MGDTCSGEFIAPLSRNADIVVHEATNAFFRDNNMDRKVNTLQQLERDTYQHGHSTPQMAGRFAKAVNARKLVLTHFSPRYRGDESDYSMKIMWQIEAMARSTFGLRGRNDVIAAWDQMAIPVRHREDEDAAAAAEAEAETVAVAAQSASAAAARAGEAAEEREGAGTEDRSLFAEDKSFIESPEEVLTE